MPRSKRAVLGAAAAIAGLLATAALTSNTPASAKPVTPRVSGSDVRSVGTDYNNGKPLSLDRSQSAKLRARTSASAAAASGPAAVGDTKTWLALNDVTGQIYLKSYTMRGIGDHIQVWVADNTAFPSGDCRNTLGLTQITDAQVNGFVHEFDSNIYPTESASFSVPPSRDGSDADTEDLGQPDDYYKVDADQADDIVVLVDNVRDANYSAPGTPDGQTYIAGFFYSVFNDFFDRNVMTIDAYDWLHRTGANPPDNSADQAYINCAAAQNSTRPYGAARPHQYEGTFAHEYQHLLESYVDPDEESWINEGLSDYAQTLVGYVNPAIAPDKPGADSHLSCFQGFQDPAFGGPENSLTEWQDQGGPEILCDYGAAYSFMEYLSSHYGPGFMSALHTNPGNGLAGLDAVLTEASKVNGKVKPHKSAMETLHDWAAAMALDANLTTKRTDRGVPTDPWTIATMNAKINWDNPQAYNTPGAPPNGSDYVRLRKADGSYITKAKDIDSLTFDGASTLEPDPVEWKADATPPNGTTEDTTCDAVTPGTGPAALYSGCGENLDRSIVRQVTVPANATLSFDALWDTEDEWDYGFVQVSTDGGKTWTSLATQDTTTEHDPGAVSGAVQNLPGFTGDSGTWRPQSASLSAYAGKTVLLGFRYITDSGVNEAGFWVRNIKVGATTLPSTLDGWKSISQINPPKVAGYTVQIVGYDGTGHVAYTTVPLNSSFDGSLSLNALRRELGTSATTVAAIVTFDDPTESNTKYARYQLKVNGVLQPGG